MSEDGDDVNNDENESPRVGTSNDPPKPQSEAATPSRTGMSKTMWAVFVIVVILAFAGSLFSTYIMVNNVGFFSPNKCVAENGDQFGNGKTAIAYNDTVFTNLFSGDVSILNTLQSTSSINSRLVVGSKGLYTSNEVEESGFQIVSGSTVATDMTLYMGADPTNGVSYLQSVLWGAATAPLVLNGRGGRVCFGGYGGNGDTYAKGHFWTNACTIDCDGTGLGTALALLGGKAPDLDAGGKIQMYNAYANKSVYQRVDSAGNFQLLNNAYNAVMLSVDQSGAIGGRVVSSSDGFYSNQIKMTPGMLVIGAGGGQFDYHTKMYQKDGGLFMLESRGDADYDSNIYRGGAIVFRTVENQNGAGTVHDGLYISRFGEVCVNTTTPTVGFALTVAGSVKVSGTVSSASDKRLKENVVETKFGLETLKQIEVVDYNFIGNQEEAQGMIAQDLYEVYKYPVTPGGEDVVTQPWTIDYSRLVPLLIQSVKQLEARVAELEAQVF